MMLHFLLNILQHRSMFFHLMVKMRNEESSLVSRFGSLHRSTFQSPNSNKASKYIRISSIRKLDLDYLYLGHYGELH